MKTNTATTAEGSTATSGRKRLAKWATLILLAIGAGLGLGGCADYYGAYPAYGGGYYASNYYGPGYGYYDPYYGGPYGYPYGYGGTSVVISSGRYLGPDGRWYYRRPIRPRQQVTTTTNTGTRNTGSVRTPGRTVRPTRVPPRNNDNTPPSVSQPARQP